MPALQQHDNPYLVYKKSLQQSYLAYYCPNKPVCRLQIYERTCPTINNVCQPSDSAVNTGTLNAQGTNTSSVYTNPSAPVYFMVGNAGAVPSSPSRTCSEVRCGNAVMLPSLHKIPFMFHGNL